MKQKLLNSIRLRVWMLLAVLVSGINAAWGESVKYSVASPTSVTKSQGTAPDGSSVTFVNTYTTTATQMTGGKSQTLTLKGWNGCHITNITLSMKSNKSSGAGKLRYSTDGGSIYTYLAGSISSGASFNTAAWYGSWSQDYVNVSKDVDINATKSDIIIKIEATSNSLFCQSFTITYTPAATTHTLTYSATNGSIAGVDAGSNVVASGADVAESAEVTLTATPADGYTFSSWSVEGTGSTLSSTSTNPTTFTMGTADATVTANFVAAGDYISASPTTQNITYAAGDVEFTISTDQTLDEDPTQFYTTADGDVTTDMPSWITDVLYDEGTLLLSVAANTGAARTAYFRVEKGSVKSDVVTINQAAYVAVTSVALDITSKSLLVEGTVTLNATVSPDNATNKNVTWESDDTDVATVSDAGVVTAVAEGTATITAKSAADPTKSATCTITVTDGSIDLRTTGEITFGGPFTGAEIGSGGYKTQNCELNGSDGNTYTWAEVDGYFNGGWQIKNSSGKITSPVIKSNYGFTISTTKETNNVTISDGTNSGQNSLTTTKTSTTITIVGDGAYAVFSKITITPLKTPVATDLAVTDPGALAIGAAGTFAYTASSEEENTASWSSATTSVINITDASTGAYTAAARGTSKITLTLTPTDATTYREVTAQRTITVTEPVVITAMDLAIATGSDPVAIGATTTDGYEGTLSYVSGDASIATVDESGNVTAEAVGSTTITISASADASNYFSSASKVINVTVSSTISVTGVSLKANTTIEKDETETLTPTFTPSTASNKNVTWESDNTDVATVSDAGVVTAVAAGTATITVTTEDGGYTATCEVTVTLPKGTEDNPYTVAEVIEMAPESTSTPASGQSDIYVVGYIVGGFNSKNAFTTTSSEFQESNLAIADDYNETTAANVIPVQLAKDSDPRDNYNVVDHKHFVNVVKVIVKADVLKYFSVPGLKNVDEMNTVAEAVKVTSAGFATWASDSPLDFTDKDIDAYIAITKGDGTGVTFTQINKVPANTGVLLHYEGGKTEEIPVFDGTGAESTAGNKFVKGAGANVATDDGDNYNYILNKPSEKPIGFYRANDQMVAKNRAYISIAKSESASVKEFLSIDFDSVTGINGITPATSLSKSAQIYNLAGQRMSKLQKGVNIVNGKKVLVK